MIAATVLFSVIFSGLRAMDASYEMYIAIIALVTLTALSQAFFGKTPRIASTLVGVITFVPWFIIMAVSKGPGISSNPEMFVSALLIVTAFSALVGYLSGALAAGIVLILDKIERRKK